MHVTRWAEFPPVAHEPRESESEDWNEPKFRCERLCTTPKLLEKLGNTAKVSHLTHVKRAPLFLEHAQPQKDRKGYKIRKASRTVC